MKKPVFLLFAIFICELAHPQKLKPEIMSGGGGFMNNAGVKMTYTIGEPVTGKVAYGSSIVTQGFQQNWKAISTSLSELPANPIKINVFPNPVMDMVTLAWQPETAEPMKMTLIDMSGKTLFQQIILKNSVEKLIDLTPYPEGIYLIRITTLAGKPSGIFKIQKTN